MAAAATENMTITLETATAVTAASLGNDAAVAARVRAAHGRPAKGCFVFRTTQTRNKQVYLYRGPLKNFTSQTTN